MSSLKGPSLSSVKSATMTGTSTSSKAARSQSRGRRKSTTAALKTSNSSESGSPGKSANGKTRRSSISSASTKATSQSTGSTKATSQSTSRKIITKVPLAPADVSKPRPKSRRRSRQGSEEGCTNFHDSCASLESVSFFPLTPGKESSEAQSGRRAGLARSNSSESFAEFLDLSPDESENKSTSNERKKIVVVRKKKKKGTPTPQRSRPENETEQEEQIAETGKVPIRLVSKSQSTAKGDESSKKNQTPKRKRPTKSLMEQLAEKLSSSNSAKENGESKSLGQASSIERNEKVNAVNDESRNSSFSTEVSDVDGRASRFLSLLEATAAVTAKTEKLIEERSFQTSDTAASSTATVASNTLPNNSKSAIRRFSQHEDEEEDEAVRSPSFTNDHARVLAPQFAAVAARQFDAYFTLKDPKKEKKVCMLHGPEVIWDGTEPIRISGHYLEYPLKALNIVLDLTPEAGQFGSKMERARDRLKERCMDGSYCVKYVKPGALVDSKHGPNTVADLVLELRILQNLPGHPNIAPLYAMHHKGVDALTDDDTLNAYSLSDPSDLSYMRNNAFFWISDRIQELLPDRVEAWKKRQGYNNNDEDANGHTNASGGATKFNQRLEVALDISSALLFLHDRKIVFHIRPEKVGFDAKCGCLKLFNFTEAREEGLGASDQSPYLTEAKQLSTLAYTAPEVLCNARHVTSSSDVYGFGILLWYVVSLKAPYDGMFPSNSTNATVSKSAVRQDYFQSVIKQHKRPRIRGKWPHELAQLLEGCWDPYLRMTMKRANEQLEGMLLF